MGRRQGLRFATALGLVGALLSACGRGAPAPSATPPSLPSATAPLPQASSKAYDPTEHDAELAAGPKGVRLVATVVGGRTRFAEGEPIAINLSFTSSMPDTYRLDLATYDRSGRLTSEAFGFERDVEIVDPLADFFADGAGMFGGLRPSPPTLTAEPIGVEVTLNEWVRFPGPGTFRFYVQSTRVSQLRRQDGASHVRVGATTSENVLEVEIVRDEAWADAELARVQKVLATEKDENAQRAASRSFRFLTTPAAARARVDALCRGEGGFNLYAGLYGAPDREKVNAWLEEGLARPDCVIDPGYLDLVARLSVAKTHPARSDRSQDEFERRLAALKQAEAAALAKLLLALPAKADAARPETLRTALSAMAMSPPRTDAERAQADAVRAALGPVFGRLPEGLLEHVLEDEWPLVRSPALVPALTALASEARPRGGMMRSASDLALERLLELDYEAGKRVILAELGRGARTSFSGATLGLLRDGELPQLDPVLARGLALPETDGESLELRAEIFARYASGALVRDAWSAYRQIPYFRVSLLSYLMRHDPEHAQKEIARLSDFDSLNRLARFTWNRALETAVIRTLGEPGAEQPARLLAEHGGPAAEKALMTRLATLRGKPDERETARSIREALTHAEAWMTPPDKLRAVAALCDDDACKREMQGLLERWGTDGKHAALVLWTTRPRGGLMGSLGHYDIRSTSDLRARIEQLPPGMTLEWQTQPKDVDAAVMADARAWADKRRIKIVAKDR